MGLLSLVIPPLGPFVWYYAHHMLGDIDKSTMRIEGREAIAIGRTLGAMVTVLIPLVVYLFTVS